MNTKHNIQNSNFILEDLDKPFLWYTTDFIKSLPHLHYHLEIMYVITGCATICIDSQEYTLQSGDIAVISPYQIHYSVDSHAKVAFFIFTPDTLIHMNDKLTRNILINPHIKKNTLSNLTVETLNTVITTHLSDTICYAPNTTVIGMLYILLTDIFEKNELKQHVLSKDIESFKPVFKYIDENYTKKISLTSAAKALGFNYYYLSRLFSRYLNISFTEYVNNKRLLLAYTLICNSNKTILEIMYATGYTSERTFYRCFKDYFNMTPMQLRNINKY